MRNTRRNVLIGLAAVVVAACGGGGGSGGDAVDTSAAAGLYHGTAGGRNVDWLVLEDGTFWSIYKAVSGSGLGGAMQGTGSLSGDNYTAHAKNFYWEDGGVQISNVTISAA